MMVKICLKNFFRNLLRSQVRNDPVHISGNVGVDSRNTLAKRKIILIDIIWENYKLFVITRPHRFVPKLTIPSRYIASFSPC
jgi:hypothetical protein